MEQRPFEHDPLTTRVVFGPGRSRTDLVDEVDRLGGDRVLLLATDRERALAEELAAALGDRLVATFADVRPHVPTTVADAARALAAERRADLLLSVGGGSTTGTAKAVALTGGQPIVAVPTTYAGSEVTPVWGLTTTADDGSTTKTTGRDPRVLPRTVVYDPELTRTLPVDLSVASAINAMAHSVEAFWAPGRDPVALAYAERSIHDLATGLPGVVADPADLDARGDVLLGAWLAGAAFALAGSALHHRICHVLGGAYDLPHAQTHTIVLPHVLAINGPAVPAAAARIATALGAEVDDDPAAAADRGLARLLRQLDAPRALRDIGLAEADLDAATDLVLAAVPPDGPRPLDRDDVAHLLRAAWAGELPAS